MVKHCLLGWRRKRFIGAITRVALMVAIPMSVWFSQPSYQRESIRQMMVQNWGVPLLTSRTISVVPKTTKWRFSIFSKISVFFMKVVWSQRTCLGIDLDHILHEQSYTHFQWFAHTSGQLGLHPPPKSLDLLYVIFTFVQTISKTGDHRDVNKGYPSGSKPTPSIRQYFRCPDVRTICCGGISLRCANERGSMIHFVSPTTSVHALKLPSIRLSMQVDKMKTYLNSPIYK